jgi:hypothetical protein
MREPIEQIQVILGGDVFHWGVEQLPEGVSIDDVRFSDLVSVTRRELHDYVAVHGFPPPVVTQPGAMPAAEEHFGFDEQADGRWAVYYRERGKRSTAAVLDTYDAAREWMVDYLFDSARTMLNHRWWHAHPESRPPRIPDMP